MEKLIPLAVVGSVNIDLVALVERLPTAGETISAGELQRRAGGKGANQAAAASRLGADVRMIGAVGDDADGRAMLGELRGAGVDVAGIAMSASATGSALVIVDAAGENQIVVCPGANALVSVGEARFLEDEAVLMQFEIDMATVLKTAALARGFLAVNASPARRLPAELLDRVDLFVVNETEYALMPELNEARLVAVTYGAEGAALLRLGSESARAPGFKAQVVNTVGAGDAFCAALAVALGAGIDDDAALRAACAVGAAAVAHPATRAPLDSLQYYLQAFG